MAEPVFYYDFSSPYSYLAAHRVEVLLPVPPRWQPILFGGLIRSIGKQPWSLREGPDRDAQMRECVLRAEAVGLPLHWPPGWPTETYSVLAVQTALAAQELGRVREFSLAAFEQGLGLGRDLTDPAVLGEAAAVAGLDAEATLELAQRPQTRERMREVTESARELGVTGIPTVVAARELFWGDDRLEDAAAFLGAAPER